MLKLLLPTLLCFFFFLLPFCRKENFMFLKEQERKPYQRLKLRNDPRHLDPKCKEMTRSPKALWNLKIRRGKKCKVGAYAYNG